MNMHGLFCRCGAHHHPTAAEHGSAIPRAKGETVASLVFTGSGLEWQERAKPRIKASVEAIVRPIASTTCDLDHHILAGKTPIRAPFSIGHEAVGEVVEIGDDVKTVSIGDIVSIPWHFNCGTCDRCLSGLTAHCRKVTPGSCYGLPPGECGGLFDDLVRVPWADGMLLKLPEGVDPVAAVSASDNLSIGWEVTAPHLKNKPSARVLVIGGVNSIGLYVAEFARALGAGEVVYCDTSERRLAIATQLGVTPHAGLPDDAIGTFDLSVDASCDPSGLRRAITALEPEGVCESVGIYFSDVPLPTYAMYSRGVRFRTGKGNARHAMGAVLKMLADKQIRPDLIHSVVLPWDRAAEELGASDKPVFTRSPMTR
ncbi:zinc-dependent alcohol dehydrogenase [Bradyrhizobium sp. USDA 4502]